MTNKRKEKELEKAVDPIDAKERRKEGNDDD